jgi:hypothetical protein
MKQIENLDRAVQGVNLQEPRTFVGQLGPGPTVVYFLRHFG